MSPVLKSGLVSRLIARLTTPRAVRLQLALFLYAVKIETLVEREYERRFHRPAQLYAADQKKSTAAARSEIAPFPALPNRKFWSSYEQFCAWLMVVLLVKYTIPQRLLEAGLLAAFDWDHDKRLLGMPPYCLVPGRLVMLEAVRSQFAGCIASLLICVRLILHRPTRPYVFSLVDFLVQDEAEIEHFYALYEEALASGYYKRLKRHPLASTMCFKMSAPVGWRPSIHHDHCQFRLRPNRTRESRAKLKCKLALATFATTTVFLWLFSVAGLVVFTLIFTDFGHLYAYRDCSPQLKLEFETRPGHRWFWVTNLTAYRLVMILADLVENVSIGLSSLLSITYLFALPYLLNEDLKIYWTSLQSELEFACQRRRSLRRLWPNRFELNPTPNQASNAQSEQEEEQQQVAGATIHISRQRAHFSLFTSPQDCELHKIRGQVRDFLDQIGQVGSLVNKIISFGFVAWLYALVIICQALIKYCLAHPNYLIDTFGISLPTLMLLVLPFSAGPISFFGVMLFQIYSDSLKTYRSLSSFIASDRSSAAIERLRFQEEISENYLGLKRNCYKIFHTYPFKPTSYFSLIGWTISALAVMFSLISRPAAN